MEVLSSRAAAVVAGPFDASVAEVNDDFGAPRADVFTASCELSEGLVNCTLPPPPLPPVPPPLTLILVETLLRSASSSSLFAATDGDGGGKQEASYRAAQTRINLIMSEK